MYRGRYAEIAADDQSAARRHELRALNVVLDRLDAARAAPGDSERLSAALDAAETLWSAFLSDVAHKDNALPREIRQNIISIGSWVFKQSAALRAAGGGDLDSLISVNAAIRDGLKAGQ